MIIIYLAGFTRLIRGSLCTWYTILLSFDDRVVFMETFCDHSFLIVFIQTEEDPLLYTVEKKVVLKNCQYLYNIRRARSVFLNSVFNNNVFFLDVLSVQALLIKSNVLWPSGVNCGRKALREKIWFVNVQRKRKPFFLRRFRWRIIT